MMKKIQILVAKNSTHPIENTNEAIESAKAAITKGDLEKFKVLTFDYNDISEDSTKNLGEFFLALAVDYNQQSIVNFLLYKKKINCSRENYKIIFADALGNGFIEIAKSLLKYESEGYFRIIALLHSSLVTDDDLWEFVLEDRMVKDTLIKSGFHRASIRNDQKTLDWILAIYPQSKIKRSSHFNSNNFIIEMLKKVIVIAIETNQQSLYDWCLSKVSIPERNNLLSFSIPYVVKANNIVFLESIVKQRKNPNERNSLIESALKNCLDSYDKFPSDKILDFCCKSLTFSKIDMQLFSNAIIQSSQIKLLKWFMNNLAIQLDIQVLDNLIKSIFIESMKLYKSDIVDFLLNRETNLEKREFLINSNLKYVKADHPNQMALINTLLKYTCDSLLIRSPLSAENLALCTDLTKLKDISKSTLFIARELKEER